MTGTKPWLAVLIEGERQMPKWEYMWILQVQESGTSVYVANGERLQAHTHCEALNLVGNEGWELVTIVVTPPNLFPAQTLLQFCLKRPIAA